ncbi:MAG: hypothetical protein RI894_1339 [Bacteroidota bacterium]|jgi:N-acetylglutamate synthase-like GNAT family acetyltransferase
MVEISTDKSRLNTAKIHDFLCNRSYWAKGIPIEVVERSIEHSLCLGAYIEGEQAGFARVITDFATFAYICDMVIFEEYRGKNISKQIMATIMAHESLQRLRRMMLFTLDAHGLYRQFGFENSPNPERMMQIASMDVYK